jgi:hypothetical protein
MKAPWLSTCEARSGVMLTHDGHTQLRYLLSIIPDAQSTTIREIRGIEAKLRR